MERIVTLTMNPALDVSAEVEALRPGQKLRSPYRRNAPGGGGINVARVIQRLDGDVAAVYPAGGAVGEMLNRLLEDEGVARHPVPIEAMTRESFAVHVRASDEVYHLVMPGPELSRAEAERCLDALESLDPAPRYLVASGSLPPGVDDGLYARVARLARARGMRLILDTSGEPLRAALDEPLYLVKPSRREFAELTGQELASDEAGRLEQVRGALEASRAEIMVVTMGAEGAVLATRGQQLRARPPELEALSPIGAGDSFVALLTLKLAQGRSLEEALRYAVAGAAAAVLTPGSQLCRAEDVERLYEQMLDDPSNLRTPEQPE